MINPINIQLNKKNIKEKSTKMIEYKTRVNKINKQNNSLKITIPQGIVKLLDLKDGDDLTWIVDIEDNIKICIEKSSKDNN